MPRPREYDDALRVRLLDAAARLLVDEGAGAVTTRRVAAEVGTSTTAIYSLIGSKADLMRAVSLEGFRRLADHLGAVPRTDDALEDLGGLGRAYFAMALEHPALYRIMFSHATGLGALLEDPDDVAFTMATLHVMIDAVQRCVDDGWFVGPAEQVATQMWALGHGIASLSIAGLLPDGPATQRLFEETFLALVIGLNHAAVEQGGNLLPDRLRLALS